MICKNCNTQVSDSSRFCPNCGVRIPVDEPQPHSHGFCTECGSPLQEGLKFCIQCGAPVPHIPQQPVQPAPQPQPTVGIVMPPEPPTEDEKKKHSKKLMWWLIPLILVVVGGIVAVILLTRSDSSVATYSWDEEYETVDDTIEYVPDSTAEVSADYDEAKPVEGDITLTGYWQETEVELTFHFTVYPDGSVDAAGKAVYKPDDRVLTYSLQGSGYDYESYSTIDFREYDSAGDYTGRWSGRFEFVNPNYTYSGAFYNENDDRYCDFNLSGSI